MAKYIIGLSKEGVIKDLDIRIDYVMCVFFFAKHSQSTLYRNAIVSLAKIIQQYGNDDLEVSIQVKNQLQSFLLKFFNTAEVLVNPETSSTEAGIGLRIEANITDVTDIGLVSTSVGYALRIRDSALKSIVNVGNGTTLYSS